MKQEYSSNTVNSNLGYQEAKLPNITGTFKGNGHDTYQEATGCCVSYNTYYSGGMSAMDWNNRYWGIDASRSSSAYADTGNDTKGKPLAAATSVKVYAYTRYK